MPTISIKLPFALADIAAKIGRAMDNDVGGEKSFTRDIASYEGETPIYADTISTSAPCTELFFEQSQAMMADPSLLFAACAMDYSQRWPDLDPPTLAECEAFVVGIIPPPV